jgi:hypothetical protein
MFGFEMTGRSTHGFYWHSSAWTEGSLLFAKLALSARKLPLPMWAGPVVNAPVGGAAGKEVGAIKELFGQFKALMLYDVANLGIDAYLVVWGGEKTYLTHVFRASDSNDHAAMELLWKVDRAELGEQVVIHLCRCLQDFRLDEITKNRSDPQLYVKLEL